MKGGLTKPLEHGSSNAKGMGLIPVQAILFRAGLNEPCGSLPNKNILWKSDDYIVVTAW